MASQGRRRSANTLRPIMALWRWLSWISVSIILLGGFYRLKAWLYHSQHWPLSEWQLVGELQQAQPQAIQKVLEELQPFDSFIAQDLQVIQQRLKQLPWIAEVKIRKQWPNRLLVHCIEHQAVARWQQQRLLNQHGEPFSAPLPPWLIKQLPQLAGPKGSEQQVLATWHQLTKQLVPYGLSVTAIGKNRRQAWQLTINHSMRCLIGKQDPYQAMQRLLVLYPLLMQQRPATIGKTELVAVVDLRYQQGAAIRWEPRQHNDWNKT
ncbi:MAG: cell division protein FtsQ/DivIB [Candidatus Symbiodolus clandestinus]